jgi:hypothetical protein
MKACKHKPLFDYGGSTTIVTLCELRSRDDRRLGAIGCFVSSPQQKVISVSQRRLAEADLQPQSAVSKAERQDYLNTVIGRKKIITDIKPQIFRGT